MKHISEMSETEMAEAITARVKVAALKAGLIDLDWLKLVDTSKVTLGAYGSVQGSDELIAELKEAKPYLFGKHARDMTPEQRATKLAELKRGPPPEPMMPIDRHARDMSQAERQAFLNEVRRRFE